MKWQILQIQIHRHADMQLHITTSTAQRMKEEAVVDQTQAEC